MQADDKTFTGVEAEGAASFADDQPEDSISLEGDQPEDATAFLGDELDDAAAFGSYELDDAPPREAVEPQNRPPGAPAQVEKMPGSEGQAAQGRRKKVVFCAAAGLCALALGALMYGMILKPAKPAASASAPTTEPIPIKIHHFLPFDDFVIPFQRESNHYLSLSLSLRSADEAALNELNMNKGMYRGIIYDLLKANADQVVGHPSLAAIGERLADNLNAWLTAGRVDEVYITRFVIK
jgi:flagellar basal body-associated protein FliL